MPVSLSNFRFRKGLRGEGWATVEYYGAKGDGSSDDRAAIQAGIDDLSAHSGGRLLFGAKDYRCNGALQIRPTVGMIGCSGGYTRLVMTHPTASFFTPFVGSNLQVPTVIQDINFCASVGNSGVVFNFIGVAAQRWRIIRCAINAPDTTQNLFGTFFTDDGASAENHVVFEDCQVYRLSDGPAFQMNKSGCRTDFIRGTYTMPSSYNSEILGFYVGGGLVDGVEFDLTSHNTGSPNCILANTVTDNDVLIINNTRAFRPNALVGTRTFLKVNDGAFVKTRNIFTRGCTRYSTTGLMGFTSDLELETHYSDIPGSLTYNIRNCYSNVALLLVLSGNPSINLPSTGMYLGQKMTVSVTNISGSTIGGYFFGNVNGYAPTTIATGRTVTFTAEYSINGVGTGHWMIVGTPLAALVV